MPKNHGFNRQAEGKLALGIRRLVDRYPFHCRILERFKVQHRPDLDTMAVTVDGDNVLLLYNPDFVLEITLPELTGVLLHEVHHVLFGHVLADPADYPDEHARTIAEEVTVNEFVKEPLPDGAVTLSRVRGLPPRESTDERYARLAGKVRLSEPAPTSNPKPKDRHAGRTGADKPVGTVCKIIHGKTVDDHAVWRTAREQQERSAQALRAVVEEAVLEVGPGRIPEELRDALDEMGIGDMPATQEQRVSAAGTGKLDWRRQLRTYVGNLCEVRPVFNRPPRRFPELIGIVPGKGRRSHRPKVMVALDTSGSITPELLDIMNAELTKMARSHELIVVECDCEIHAVYEYKRLKMVKGGGGTDFRPVFQQSFLQRHRPDLVVYFTDGLGPAPTSKPSVPVIWCLLPDGEPPADWGRVIQI